MISTQNFDFINNVKHFTTYFCNIKQVNKHENSGSGNILVYISITPTTATIHACKKIPKISPGAYIFKMTFKNNMKGLFLEGPISAYFRRGLYTEGNLRFKIG